jgi:hypothetical protein
MTDLTQDPYPPDAATLHGYSRERSDLVTIIGYLGAGDSDDTRRLYAELDQSRWITVDVADIVDRHSECDDLTSGRSIVRIRRTARVVASECTPIESIQWPPPPKHYPLVSGCVMVEGDDEAPS